MLHPIVVMLERATGVVRRINEDALNLAGELLFERFEGQQVVPEDESVVEDVVIADSVDGVVRLFRVLQQNARLQLRPVLLPNPGEFEFGLGVATAHEGDLLALVPQYPGLRLRCMTA
jgi:hypothetical protein